MQFMKATIGRRGILDAPNIRNATVILMYVQTFCVLFCV